MEFQNAWIKKFEEGIFSDLRNLKPGIDATLEDPRSDFLEFLYKTIFSSYQRNHPRITGFFSKKY